MKIPVSKYHGCGNDFILARYEDVPFCHDALAGFVRAVCSRHTGIGADGCILVKSSPLEMVYFNQDGSRAPMCGNGIRCFSQFCLDEGLIASGQFAVQTLAGIQSIRVLEDGQLQVNMGKPDFSYERIGTPFPISHYGLHGQEISSFFMGTVHTVVFTEDAFGDIEEQGRAICEDPLFEQQTNVNFAEVCGRSRMKVQTYERGCGVTLACGTGVCASVVQAWLDGRTGPSVDVELKAGKLHIDIDSRTGEVIMTGPAKKIMKGIYEYDETA